MASAQGSGSRSRIASDPGGGTRPHLMHIAGIKSNGTGSTCVKNLQGARLGGVVVIVNGHFGLLGKTNR